MTNLFENKAVRYVLIACSLLIIAILAYVVSFKIIEKRNVDNTYAIARKLGYTDNSLIAFHKQCWDIGWKCGIYLHFTTDRSFGEFKGEVENLRVVERYFDNSYGNGYSLFTELNIDAQKNLTANGNTGQGNALFQIKEPTVMRWQITDLDGREFDVKFYEITKEEAVYEIDGKKVKGNIVTIILLLG